MPHIRLALAVRASARDAWPAPRNDGASPASGRLHLRPSLGQKPVGQRVSQTERILSLRHVRHDRGPRLPCALDGCAQVFKRTGIRSPLASALRRSSDTAPRAVYRIRHSNWSRRCAGIAVLACKEKPLTLAQRGPLSASRAPSEPQPEPMRRMFCPARSPKAMRCLTEAAMGRASSGSLSRSGSSPAATGTSILLPGSPAGGACG